MVPFALNHPLPRLMPVWPIYQPPPIDDAIDAELCGYIARRKAEEPDAIV